MKSITAKEVQKKLEAKEKLNILDVRQPEEVNGGHIRGIINIPLGLLEFRMQELDKRKQYIIVCRSGARSAQATNFLTSYGYDVINMTGGMMSWEGKIEY